MLLTVSTSMPRATDLGHLLHKHPDRVQSFALPVGTAHVFYPEASAERCTAALLLEVDPVALARSGGKGDRFTLGQVVNDRPYAASSLLAVAVKQVFGSASAGRSQSLPELAATAIPLELEVAAVPGRAGEDLIRRLFEPVGWTVTTATAPLDPTVPEWGASPYFVVRLTGTVRLAEALAHLYVLLPVLDDAKHYWVGDDEVEKLLRAGEGWLGSHPERELIAAGYLKHRRDLTRTALDRLAEVDDRPDDAEEDPAVRPTPLVALRHAAVLAEVLAVAPRSVGDLGCGEGALLAPLLAERRIERLVGTDVSVRALRQAARRLRLNEAPDADRARVELFQSSVVYLDDRLRGLDAAVLMEVVEHIDATRLPALEHSVFADAAPGRVVVTTPNADHNARFPSLPAGRLRHPDHRFEWSRHEFRAWADGVAGRHGYTVRVEPIGVPDADLGAPTQMAVFDRIAA